MSKTVKDLIGRLIACERSPFDEDDRTALEGFLEDRLTELVASYAKEPEAPKAEPKAATKAEPKETPKPMTEEEWLAAAPADVRSLVERSKVEEAERRVKLITAIRAADETLTEDELNAEPTSALVRLAGLAAKATGKAKVPTDYRGLEIPESGEDLSFLKPPDTYGLNKKEAN